MSAPFVHEIKAFSRQRDPVRIIYTGWIPWPGIHHFIRV